MSILQQSQSTGSLSIVSIPSGARIFIDGIEYAEYTPTIINLSPGQHTYRLVYPGFFQKDGIVNILEGQTYNLLISVDGSINIKEVIIFGFVSSFAAGLLLYLLTRKTKNF